MLVDLNRTQKSLLGSPSNSQRLGTEGPTGVSAPPVVPTVVPIPPPRASDPDLKGAIQLFTQLNVAQAQRQYVCVNVPVATQGGIAESRIKDFRRMSPPEFTGSKLAEDPQQFIDEAYRICKVMQVSDTDAVDMAAHRLKDVVVDWYDTWVASRGQKAPPSGLDRICKSLHGSFYAIRAQRGKCG